jgi:hypothetical protein
LIGVVATRARLRFTGILRINLWRFGAPAFKFQGYLKSWVGHLRDLVGFLKDNADWLAKFGEGALALVGILTTITLVTKGVTERALVGGDPEKAARE